jgi:hypothetical protein
MRELDVSSATSRELETDFLGAFLYLPPIDCDVVNGTHGMKLRPWTAPAIWKRGNVSRVRA